MTMASGTQEELYQSFLAVSGQQMSALGDTTAMLADVAAQVSEQQSISPAAAAVVANQAQAGTATQTGASTQAGTSAPAGTSAGSSSSGTGGSVASTVLESGFGLPALIAGLLGIFGGGDSSTPAPLVKYAMPAAVEFQAAESQGQVTGMNYDQMGMARSDAASGTSAGTNGTTSGGTNGGSSGTANGSGSGAAPQITVNVQAMDARSFMDRSSDIAAAVRDAMLNLNSINDVVNDL
jgi:hypothetical protein